MLIVWIKYNTLAFTSIKLTSNFGVNVIIFLVILTMQS